MSVMMILQLIDVRKDERRKQNETARKRAYMQGAEPAKTNCLPCEYTVRILTTKYNALIRSVSEADDNDPAKPDSRGFINNSDPTRPTETTDKAVLQWSTIHHYHLPETFSSSGNMR